MASGHLSRSRCVQIAQAFIDSTALQPELSRVMQYNHVISAQSSSHSTSLRCSSAPPHTLHLAGVLQREHKHKDDSSTFR
jgi:hypothetical protein